METHQATVASPVPRVGAGHRPNIVLAVMSLSIFLVLVDATVVNTALPAIARDLLASTARLQWVVDGYTLSLAGLVLLGGALGDRLDVAADRGLVRGVGCRDRRVRRRPTVAR